MNVRFQLFRLEIAKIKYISYSNLEQNANINICKYIFLNSTHQSSIFVTKF